MVNKLNLEEAIYATGAIKHLDFTSHGGQKANIKVVLDSLLNDPEHEELLTLAIEDLVHKLEPFKPELVIPMPEGANALGQRVAREIGARAILLCWRDKKEGLLTFARPHERIVVCRANRIALVDDVFTSGSTFDQAINSIDLAQKQLVGGVIFDRSNPDMPWATGVQVQSVVRRYIPLRSSGVKGVK